jgi:hypothetical protein
MCGYISERGDIPLSIHMSPPSPRLLRFRLEARVEATFPSPCWGEGVGKGLFSNIFG